MLPDSLYHPRTAHNGIRQNRKYLAQRTQGKPRKNKNVIAAKKRKIRKKKRGITRRIWPYCTLFLCVLRLLKICSDRRQSFTGSDPICVNLCSSAVRLNPFAFIHVHSRFPFCVFCAFLRLFSSVFPWRPLGPLREALFHTKRPAFSRAISNA
jgi:hypothetical protein